MLNWLLKSDPEPRGQRVAPIADIAEGETVSSTEAMKWPSVWFDGPTAAGVSVTSESAMRVSAVYGCVRLIAGAIAGLPKTVYERKEIGREKVEGHPLWWLLNRQPCPSFTAATFWEYVVTQVLLRGDAIAYIQRNRVGDAVGLLLWSRSDVEIQRVQPKDPRQPCHNRYYFRSEGRYFGAEEADVLHFAGFGYDGCRSLSVIQWGARNGIGIAMRGDEYAGKFFSQGGQPQIAVKAQGQMTNEQQAAFVAAWERKYSGSGGPNGRPLMLTEGLDVKELSMTAQDAQLLESRQWQVVDIARAFGVPPFMVAEMGKATYNNTENLSTDFVKYTLAPHLQRFEQEINIKLLRNRRRYIKFRTDGLQRADLKSRADYYKAALGGTQAPGWMEPNEVRQLEDMPDHTDGEGLARPKDTGPAAPEQTED